MHKLVLLRHGESDWNRQNLFTGWTDVDIDTHGQEQATHAGVLMREAGIQLDVAHTSYLKRAIHTLWRVLDAMDLDWIPEYKSWRLNERHYGALQGLNKAETATKYGEEKVKEWRRSYDIQPPALEEGDTRDAHHEKPYEHLSLAEVPMTESLEDTFERVLPYWTDTIAPDITSGKTVLIAAHGNTLRALCRHLDNLSDEQVVALNIPIGEPLVYELDEQLRPLRSYYLNSEEEIAKGVARQIEMGKAAA